MKLPDDPDTLIFYQLHVYPFALAVLRGCPVESIDSRILPDVLMLLELNELEPELCQQIQAELVARELMQS